MALPLTLSGQVTVTTAGTAQQLPDNIATDGGRRFYIKASPDNVGNVYIGNDGSDDVDNTTGFCMEPGFGIALMVPSMSYYWLDADNDGDSICWMKTSELV